jgi:hypothetical protein
MYWRKGLNQNTPEMDNQPTSSVSKPATDTTGRLSGRYENGSGKPTTTSRYARLSSPDRTDTAGCPRNRGAHEQAHWQLTEED